MWTASFQVDHGGQYEFTSPSDNHDGTMLKLGVSSPELVNFINSQQRAFARNVKIPQDHIFQVVASLPNESLLLLALPTLAQTV
jgi:hypothetical protein